MLEVPWRARLFMKGWTMLAATSETIFLTLFVHRKNFKGRTFHRFTINSLFAELFINSCISHFDTQKCESRYESFQFLPGYVRYFYVVERFADTIFIYGSMQAL